MSADREPGFSEDAAAFTYKRALDGIPASILRTPEKLGLTRADVRLIVSDRTLERRIAAKDVLKLDEADGIARLIGVAAHARRLFDGRDALAFEFLHLPNPALGNRPAIEVARTELGATEVHTIMSRLEYGVLS